MRVEEGDVIQSQDDLVGARDHLDVIGRLTEYLTFS